MSKKHRTLIYVAVGVTLVVGALIPRLLSSKSRGAPAPAASSAAAVSVRTVIVVPQTLTERLSTTGTVRANEDVELVAEIAGKVDAIHLREGRRVQAGQLLLEIDDTQLSAERERAIHRVSLAERSEARQRRAPTASSRTRRSSRSTTRARSARGSTSTPRLP